MPAKSKYARVNWKQSDVKIARRLGVTRQAVAKARKKKGAPKLERVHGGGRPPGPPVLPETAVIAVRVSVGHKERFDATVAPSLRREWMERRIEEWTERGDGGES